MTDREEVGVFPMVIGGEFTPHVASKIFCFLDKSALLTCRKVSREWRNLVDLETKLWSEIPPARYGEAAESGRLEICRLIIGRAVTKNPGTEKGMTPLHRAALKGHLNICRLIIQVLHDKNPGQVTDASFGLTFYFEQMRTFLEFEQVKPGFTNYQPQPIYSGALSKIEGIKIKA